MVSEVIELSFGGPGREASSSCIAPLLFYKKGRNPSQETTRPEGKVDRDEGGKRKNNEL